MWGILLNEVNYDTFNARKEAECDIFSDNDKCYEIHKYKGMP